MITLMHLMLANQNNSGDWLQYLGPFAGVAIIGGWWITDLRSRVKDAQDRVKEKDAQIQQVNDRLIELSERTLPAIAENTRALTEVLEELKRRDRR